MKIKIIAKFSSPGGPSFEYAPGWVFTRDADCDDYDWLVVFDEIPDRDTGTIRNSCETLACPKEHTILATWEPTSIKCYTKAYARQFGELLTNRPWSAEKHPSYHLGRGYYRWLTGRTYPENATAKIPPKTKLISAVCSAKAMKWTKHFARIQILKKLIAEVPGAEWYGHYIREFGKKFEVMDEYKYHVALENHIEKDYWTEKIADAFLCECLPFYAGAPNLDEVFPRESFIPIPIDDADKAISIIKSAIASNEYEKRRGAILEAKKLILEKYNFWAQTIEVIKAAEENEKASGAVLSPKGGKLYSRKYIRKHNMLAALEAGIFHFKQYFPWRFK